MLPARPPPSFVVAHAQVLLGDLDDLLNRPAYAAHRDQARGRERRGGVGQEGLLVAGFRVDAQNQPDLRARLVVPLGAYALHDRIGDAPAFGAVPSVCRVHAVAGRRSNCAWGGGRRRGANRPDRRIQRRLDQIPQPQVGDRTSRPVSRPNAASARNQRQRSA